MPPQPLIRPLRKRVDDTFNNTAVFTPVSMEVVTSYLHIATVSIRDNSDGSSSMLWSPDRSSSPDKLPDEDATNSNDPSNEVLVETRIRKRNDRFSSRGVVTQRTSHNPTIERLQSKYSQIETILYSDQVSRSAVYDKASRLQPQSYFIKREVVQQCIVNLMPCSRNPTLSRET